MDVPSCGERGRYSPGVITKLSTLCSIDVASYLCAAQWAVEAQICALLMSEFIVIFEEFILAAILAGNEYINISFQ